jgi:hypothetical protein
MGTERKSCDRTSPLRTHRPPPRGSHRKVNYGSNRRAVPLAEAPLGLDEIDRQFGVWSAFLNIVKPPAPASARDAVFWRPSL